MSSPNSVVVEELSRYLESFVESPPPVGLRARDGNRMMTEVVAFSRSDDSAVRRAVEVFDPLDDLDVLVVVHPDADGIGYFDLTDLRDQYAAKWAGAYEVFTGHPDDPFARAGVLARQEPFPVLHFVRSERIIEAEARLRG